MAEEFEASDFEASDFETAAAPSGIVPEVISLGSGVIERAVALTVVIERARTFDMER